MTKSHSDHLIKQVGFIPLVIDAVFLGDDNMTLDHYETMMFKHGKVKTAGYLGSGGLFKVIIDTRELDFIPFDYFYTYSDKMHEDVRKAVWADDKRRTEEATRLREEKEELISRPGTRVHVPQVYGRQGYTAANGTVLSREYGHAKVRLDYGIEVEVKVHLLTEPKKNPKIYTLRGELSCLYGRLEATYQKPFGVRTAVQGMIDRKIVELETLEAQPV